MGPQDEKHSKIPKLGKVNNEFCENLPWKKGDLLDSLDLGSTNMKKMFQNRPKLCDSPGRDQESKAEWLKENIRESINQWAPRKLEPLAEIKPQKRVINKKNNKLNILEKIDAISEHKTGEKKNFEKKIVLKATDFQSEPQISPREKIDYSSDAASEVSNFNKRYQEVDPKIEEKLTAYSESKASEIVPITVGKEPVRKRNSKFVNKIKSIPVKNDDFLENELICVEEEEAKLQASLARLDLKALKAKHQAHLIDLENETKKMEESLQKNIENNDLIEKNVQQVEVKQRKVARSEENHSVTKEESVYSKDESFYSKKEENRHKKKEENRYTKKEEGYSKKEVHKIGAVYNEIAARSGRYTDNNPPPEYALPKDKSKELISFRKPPPGPKYTADVVKINQNVNLKDWFKDLPKWEKS